MSLWEAWPRFAANPWAMATLYDAYFGFLTFYAWVVYKERSFVARTLWFLLIMYLGTSPCLSMYFFNSSGSSGKKELSRFY